MSVKLLKPLQNNFQLVKTVSPSARRQYLGTYRSINLFDLYVNISYIALNQLFWPITKITSVYDLTYCKQCCHITKIWMILYGYYLSWVNCEGCFLDWRHQLSYVPYLFPINSVQKHSATFLIWERWEQNVN